MPDVRAYRVLVFDDERPMCEAARNEIIEIAGPAAIHVEEAYTARVAITKVRQIFFDLIVLDLYKERNLAGLELYRWLNEYGCSAEVIIMTRFDLDASVKELLQAVASEGSAQLVGFLDKREPELGSIRTEVEKRYKKHADAHLTTEELELATRIITRRRSRYVNLPSPQHQQIPKSFPLREDPSEVEAEIERLLREVYVEVPRWSNRSSDVFVTLSPIERRGLSPAVVVNSTVRIGLHGASEVRNGHKTVLKIGPKSDILEEASRFREFVRYGVELDQRVELLGVSTRDSLGALVYSFAGGLYRKNLLSLDDVLVSDMQKRDTRLSREVLKNLFESRHWYSVKAGAVRVGEYFQANYKNQIAWSSRDAEKALIELPDEFENCIRVEDVPARGGKESHFLISVADSESLMVPKAAVLGLGSMYGLVPACLVHGDMHAGNVMLEISNELQGAKSRPSDRSAHLDRVCLIDFRNSGPGPRAIDAVALEASVRLADSEAVCRQISDEGEIALSPSERCQAAGELAGRLNSEVNLYRAVFQGAGEISYEGWDSAAAEILMGLRDCFKDITLAEYLSSCVRYTFRQLGYKMPPVARVRLLVWLAAQYKLIQELSS
jgi:Response regulator receiver domain/Phosphotransferase enzyme family